MGCFKWRVSGGGGNEEGGIKWGVSSGGYQGGGNDRGTCSGLHQSNQGSILLEFYVFRS